MSAARVFLRSPVVLTEWLGVLLLVLLALIPVVFISPYWAWLPIASPVILSVKSWVMRVLASALFVVLAARLVLPERVTIGRGAWLPMGLLGAMLAMALLSAWLGQDWRASLRELTDEGVMMLVALAAPVFLRTPLRVRLVLAGVLLAVLAVSAMVFVSSWMQDGRLIKYVYGRDWIADILAGDPDLIYRLQGGIRRVGANATLGNPEFTGTYLAVGFLLVGCGLLHGWGCRFAGWWPVWPLWLGALGLVGSGILASGTRGALVAVGAGVIICWLGAFRIRGWWMAVWLGLGMGVLLLVGFPAAAAVGLAGLAGALVWQVMSRKFMPLWRAISWPNRLLLIAAPLVVVAGMTSQSLPGPWNVGGVPLIERLTRETNTADSSVRERITFWMMAGEIVAERPLLGTGEGMFGPNFHASLVRLVEADGTGTMAYNQRLLKTWLAMETHNDYFEIAADRGLVGLGLFLGLGVALLGGLAGVARGGYSSEAKLSHALLVTLGGFHAVMATSFPLQEPARMTTFFVLVGCALGLLASGENRESSEGRDSRECGVGEVSQGGVAGG